jgi:Tfp pilus assembly pilus retraction ATPase PilT
VLAGDVLCELLRKDIDAAGIGTDVFLGYLTGDEGEAAGNALIEAIIDFFPSRQRSLLREMLAKNQSVMLAADQVAREELNDPLTLEAMTAKAVKAIREEFAKIRTP